MDPRTAILLEAPVGRTILGLALPNVVVMVAQASIGLIETYFVAKLGLDALAGMALVFPLFMLLQMVSAGAMGGGILSAIARALGSGRRDRANELVWYAVAITVGARRVYNRRGAFVRAETLCIDGRTGRLTRRGRNLLDDRVRRNDSVVDVQFVRRDHSRHRQHVLSGRRRNAVGAVFLIPLSPVLIFGYGPLPQLGSPAARSRLSLYYAIGCLIFAGYIWSAGRAEAIA